MNQRLWSRIILEKRLHRVLLAGSVNRNPSRPRSPDAGIADSRESQDTGIARIVAIGGKLSRTVLANSVTRPKKLTLLCDPYRRPYLRRSSPEPCLMGLCGNSKGLL